MTIYRTSARAKIKKNSYFKVVDENYLFLLVNYNLLHYLWRELNSYMVVLPAYPNPLHESTFPALIRSESFGIHSVKIPNTGTHVKDFYNETLNQVERIRCKSILSNIWQYDLFAKTEKGLIELGGRVLKLLNKDYFLRLQDWTDIDMSKYPNFQSDPVNTESYIFFDRDDLDFVRIKEEPFHFRYSFRLRTQTDILELEIDKPLEKYALEINENTITENGEF